MTKSKTGSQGITGIAKRGDIYWARFRCNNKLIQQSLHTSNLRVARRKLKELRATTAQQFTSIDTSGQVNSQWHQTKGEALRYIKQHVSAKQYEEYVHSATLFHTICAPHCIGDLNEGSILLFVESRRKQVQPKTINKQVGNLLNLFKVARQLRLHDLPQPHYQRLKHTPGKERRALTVEEIGKLLKATERPQERLMWLTALKTGMRAGEFTGLKWRDLRKDHIALQAKGTKSRRYREIPLPCDFIKQLRQHREHPEYVFVNTAGNPWRNNLLTRFYVRCKAAGINDGKPGGSVDIHSLRVTFVTQAIEAGCDPRSVQEIVGHSTVELTLKIYTKSTDASKRRVSERLPY
ncbi:site-specific integrase [Bremerella sp. P1]|uniref:site-specific integrase n=1 Tax=Bremerella sp. P1 TaxID=3026424 RepID=UPI002368B1AF|nr:site-specific integrase [Bremerella sp. P1]WDI44745.1 site-specific integrase [Bremerella sp. P1]